MSPPPPRAGAAGTTLLVAMLVAFAAQAAAARAQYSNAWGANGQLWRPEGRLSDWSYSGEQGRVWLGQRQEGHEATTVPLARGTTGCRWSPHPIGANIHSLQATWRARKGSPATLKLFG